MLLLDVDKVPIWLSLTAISLCLVVVIGLSLRHTRGDTEDQPGQAQTRPTTGFRR
jgi:hypothetical protein